MPQFRLQTQANHGIMLPELSMDSGELRARIVCDFDLMHGEPCIRGTRIPVALIVASLADMSIADLLQHYPQLVIDDVRAALIFASEATHNTLVA